MNKEIDTNTNETNQDFSVDFNVTNDTNVVPTNSNQQTSSQVVQPQSQVVNQSAPSSTPPKVVKIEHVKEVVKETKLNANSQADNKVGTKTSDVSKGEVITNKKGGFFGRFVLFIFIIFLFFFVYYLPQISNFIENYKKEKSGIEDGSMRSGTMTCTLTKDNNDNLSTIYETTFTYTKNKLKKTEQVISYKLTDNAISSDTLDDSELQCENLKSTLVGVSGIEISCSKTAVMQKTTQSIDYTKFNVEAVTTNVAEYNGFYPEYQLDQSIAGIRKNLEDAGYSCISREY